MIQTIEAMVRYWTLGQLSEIVLIIIHPTAMKVSFKRLSIGKHDKMSRNLLFSSYHN